ncbi:MAG: response regulator [Ktedonobacteraceae bacterium]|nr:response regulator [Ktedonobacteraceae bacterium]
MNRKPYKILVVDDDPVIRDMMIDILSLEGYPIEVSRNGSEALKKLHGEENYLVFLDLMMSGINGQEVCENLNAHPAIRKHHIIILMSALDNLALAKSLGVNGVMSKPFAVEDVLRVVEPYIVSPDS